MAFPTLIFAGQDWSVVWIFPVIMAVAFGVFLRDGGVGADGNRRPMLQRFVASFVLYGSVWIPFKIFGDAVERGAAAQGFDSPAGWGFGVGLASGVIFLVALMAVAAMIAPLRNWLGYNRNPFKSAGKS